MMEIGEAFTIDNKSFLKSFDSTFLKNIIHIKIINFFHIKVSKNIS